MKGKKIFLIILAAVIFVGAAVAAVKITLDQKKMTEEIINLLMKGESVSAFQVESMLKGEYKIGAKYLRIKDTEKFQEKLCAEISEFLSSHADADNLKYVQEKLLVVTREGLLNDEAVQLIEEHRTACAKQRAEELVSNLQNGKYKYVAEDITWLMEMEVVEESGVELDVVINSLLENCKVYSIKNNVGAYYDNVELESSSHRRDEGVSWMDPIGYTRSSYVEKAYGDFCIGTSRSTTHYEALEGFDFEHKYNTSSTSKKLFLRGKEINGHFWSDTVAIASGQGTNYVIVAENEVDGDELNADGVLFIGKDKLLAMTYYGTNSENIIGYEGDFTQYVSLAGKLYNEKYSQKVELEEAKRYMDNKQYEEAMNILTYYTHVDGALDSIYTIAVESMRAGNTEFALETLCYIPYFDQMDGLDWEYLVKNFEGRYSSDVNTKEYTKPFSKFMMDVLGTMKDEDIVKAFSGKSLKVVSKGRYVFNEDRTGIKYAGSTNGFNNKFTWEVKDGQITISIEGNNNPVTYGVYNILPNYYLLAYTTEHSTSIFRVLLKAA